MATIKLKGAEEKEVIQNGNYRESGATALSDAGTDVTSAIVITDNIDIGNVGEYYVTYTLPAEDTGEEADTVATRKVTVTAAVGTKDTTFDLGDELKDGTDVSGSTYDKLVDAGTTPPDSASAYFSGTALDPYEVQHSK